MRVGGKSPEVSRHVLKVFELWTLIRNESFQISDQVELQLIRSRWDSFIRPQIYILGLGCYNWVWTFQTAARKILYRFLFRTLLRIHLENNRLPEPKMANLKKFYGFYFLPF